MGKFKPNDDQKLFLNTNGCNVLVSASAGSGKTSTMIQKLLQLLDTYRFPISSLLVVTFTNSAGAEIRQRLYEAISDHLATLTNASDIEYFQKQLENIGNAEIGTLHAICKKLITKYFYVIEQSPDFSLIVSETDYLYDLAIESVFREHILSEDTEFFDLYNSYNSNRDDGNLRTIIKKLHEFSSSKPDYVIWREAVSNLSYDTDLDKNIACDYILKDTKESFSKVMPELKELQALSLILQLEKHCYYLSIRLQFIDAFNTASSFTQALKIYNNFESPNKPRKKKIPDPSTIEFEEKFIKVADRFKGCFDGFKKHLIYTDPEKIVEDISVARANLRKIMSLSDEIEDEYSRLKKERNVVDFNDLEMLMLQILENDTVREELKEHYKFIFFDEYQDINEKQELILSKLTSGDNYYMIGDVKQSIYAFRQASPQIFISKFQNFMGDGDKNKLIRFNQNYRSEKNILEYANQVFDTLITNDTIGIDYKTTARFESDKKPNECRVKLSILDTFDSEKNKEKAEAMVVANEIINLLQKTKADGTKFDYKDIAIILRSRGKLAYELFNTLSNLQIPVNTEIESEFFSTNEVTVLISVLKCISNYEDDLAVATVLKMLFKLNEDELMCIRESGSNKFFYKNVFEYNANDEIMAKISKFKDFIDYYKMYLMTHSVSDTLWDIIDKFSLLLFFKSLPDGIERENNILEFVSFSDNDSYKYNVDKLLNYIDFVSQNKLKQVIGTKGNAVEICTIHHSKGLEYPAVIFCGIGREIKINKDTNNLTISNVFGFGLKSIDLETRVSQDTIVRSACKLSSRMSEYDEEIRLLYVAMTRPREYLRLIGTFDLSVLERCHDLPIYFSFNMLDMILKSYSATDIKKIMGGGNFCLNKGLPNESEIEVVKIDDIEVESKSALNSVQISGGNVALEKKLKWVYANPPSNATFTIKNTVTNILREEVDYENLISAPKTFTSKDKIDGVDALKLGTAYHSVMQRVNFNESAEDIEGLINGLVDSGEIDVKLKPYIKIDEIVDACKTIGNIVRSATSVYKEKQFIMQEDYNKLVKNSDNKTKVIVQGVIDLVVIRGNEALLIDYKTNKVSSPDFLIKEYAMQLDIYAKAFELAHNIKITNKYLYSFYQHKLIEVK